MIADGITTAVLLVAPAKTGFWTVMSFADGTVTLQPVARLMLAIFDTRLVPETPSLTATCNALGVVPTLLVSTSIVNVIVAARRATELWIATPAVYVMDPEAALHQTVLTI